MLEQGKEKFKDRRSAFIREDGLNCSEKMLTQDTNSFTAFFNDIKEKTKQLLKENFKN